MKRMRLFAIATVSLLTGWFIGCGDSASSDEDMDPTGKYLMFETVDDLPQCIKSKDGDSVYLESEKMYLTCTNGFWSEFIAPDDGSGLSNHGKLNIYAEADDTIPSLSMLGTCSYSYEGTVVFIASLNSYMKCYDYDWIEFTPRKTSSSSSASSMDTVATFSKLSSLPCNSSREGDSVFVKEDAMVLVCEDGAWTEYNAWSSSSKRSSSSSARTYDSGNVLRDTILGVCDASKEGTLAKDSARIIRTASTDMYECRSGLWLSTTETYLDTRGFPMDTVEGAFKRGIWVEDRSTTIDEACEAPFNKGNTYTYVFTQGDWKKASAMDIYFNKACIPMNNGATNKLKGVTYKCNGSSWSEILFYAQETTDYFSHDVAYGSLTDSRDGKTYKTVTIGGREWMAENLNFADSVNFPNLQFGNFCYSGKPENCEKSGRFYTWTAALNLVSGFQSTLRESLDSTGICPSGWHVPDTAEWRSLVTAVPKAVDLMAEGAWHASSATNASGFTALPSGDEDMEDGGYHTVFCTSSQYNSSRNYVYEMTYSASALSRDYHYKSDYCSVRCVKNRGTAVVPASSSSVAESSSNMPPPSSESIVPSSSSVVLSSSEEENLSSAAEENLSSAEDGE